MIVREGVEGLNEHLVFAFFDMEIADRAVGDATAGIEGLKKLLVALGSLQLGLYHPKHIGRHRFPFAFRGVTNDGVSIDFLVELRPKRRGDDTTSLRQELLAGAEDFGDHQMPADKGDHMSVTCDIDSSRVVRALDVFRFVDLKKLWVDRSSVNIQCVFCDSRSDRKHSGPLGDEWEKQS